MRHRLVVIAGPLRGLTADLDGEGVSIGRDPSCSLCLPDATLSRRHALVVPNGEGAWLLRDLGSLNGVRVNGQPVSECVLAEGDQVQIGESRVALATGDGEPSPAIADEPPLAEPTLRLSFEDARWATASPGRAPSELAVLLAASRSFAEARSEEALAETLLAAALRLVPAGVAALFLSDGDGALREAARRGGKGALSATAASRAAARGEALAFGGDEPAGAAVPESVRTSGTRQAFVPLVNGAGTSASREAAGVLALSRGALDPPFAAEELELLFGLTASASTALSVVRHVAWLDGERRRLTALAAPGDEMIGDSPAMARVRGLVARAAASDATVLLLGPSGAGKELAARAIHLRSARRDGPFVAVNAAALAETLVESELFGHEKGAFTGALSRRAGKLEAAHRGTLFLDEIGEMSPAVQAKLLRVLETRQLERVGSNTPVKVDVRIVAATNRDLAAEARTGRFRADLYYRLNVVAISMPSLAERREDVPALASHFLARQAERLGRRFDGFSPAALRRLVSYGWPGNVRELANAVERAAVLADGGLILPEDLPEALLEGGAGGGPGADTASRDEGLAPYHEAVNAAKREAVASALSRSGGNVTEAARLLGLHPNYLHRLLNQLGLRDA